MKQQWLLINLSNEDARQIIDVCHIAEDDCILSSTIPILSDEMVVNSQVFIVADVRGFERLDFIRALLSPTLHGHLMLFVAPLTIDAWDTALRAEPCSIQMHVHDIQSQSIVSAVEAFYDQIKRADVVKSKIQAISPSLLSFDHINQGNPAMVGAEKLIEDLPIAMAIIENATGFLVKYNVIFEELALGKGLFPKKWTDYLELFQIISKNDGSLLIQTKIIDASGHQESMPRLWDVRQNRNTFAGHTLVYMHDVTQIHWHRAQHEVLLQQAEMKKVMQEQRDKMDHMMRLSLVGEAATGIAHQITQPLAVLSSSLQMAKADLSRSSGSISHSLRDLITQSCDMCENMGEIIHSIRNTIQFSSSKYDVLSASHLIKQLESRFYYDHMVLNVSGEMPSTVVTDVRTVEQVLIILTQNSIDCSSEFSMDKVIVDITLEVSEAGLMILHRDNGCGIAVEVAERMFEPFYTTKQNGSGIGLSLVVSLLEVIGGKIIYRNSDFGGAAFKITLPLEPVVSQVECVGVK